MTHSFFECFIREIRFLCEFFPLLWPLQFPLQFPLQLHLPSWLQRHYQWDFPDNSGGLRPCIQLRAARLGLRIEPRHRGAPQLHGYWRLSAGVCRSFSW